MPRDACSLTIDHCTEIVSDPEAAEPGFCTVTVSDPAEDKSPAGIATPSCDELMNVVVRGDPFQRVTAPGDDFGHRTQPFRAGLMSGSDRGHS